MGRRRTLDGHGYANIKVKMLSAWDEEVPEAPNEISLKENREC